MGPLNPRIGTVGAQDEFVQKPESQLPPDLHIGIVNPTCMCKASDFSFSTSTINLCSSGPITLSLLDLFVEFQCSSLELKAYFADGWLYHLVLI